MTLALSVTTVDQARFVVNSMRMLQQYHKTVQSLKSIDVQGTVFATSANGSIVITAPVNYLSWSKELDKFSSNKKFSGKKHEVWIAGTMSETAREQLKERDWEVHERSKLFTRIATPKEARN